MNIDEMIPVFDDDAFKLVEQTEEVIEDNNPPVDPTPVDPEETPVNPIVEPEVKVEDAPVGDEVATLFFNKLVDEGIVEKQDKDEYTWEDIQKVTNHYKNELPNQVAQAIVEQVPDIGKDLIDYVMTKGESLTKENLNSFYKEYLSDIDERQLDLDNLEEVRDYLTTVYTNKGFRKSQINAALDALEDEDDTLTAIKEEASKELSLENSTRKSKQLLEAEKTNKSEASQNQKQFAENVFSELDNSGWNKNYISDVKQKLSTGDINTVFSKANKSPKATMQLASLALFYDDKTNTFDLSSFIKELNTEQVNTLKDKITRDMFNSGSKSKAAPKIQNKWSREDLTPID